MDYIHSLDDLDEVEKLAFVFQAGVLSERGNKGRGEMERLADNIRSFIGFLEADMFSLQMYHDHGEEREARLEALSGLYKKAAMRHVIQAGVPEPIARMLYGMYETDS